MLALESNGRFCNTTVNMKIFWRGLQYEVWSWLRVRESLWYSVLIFSVSWFQILDCQQKLIEWWFNSSGMFWSEKPLGTTLVQFEREDLFVMQMNSTWLCVWTELCLFQRQIAILTFDKCLCLSCICACSCLFWLYFVFVLYSPTTSFRLDFWLFICIFVFAL